MPANETYILVCGVSPSDKINMAFIGVGAQGFRRWHEATHLLFRNQPWILAVESAENLAMIADEQKPLVILVSALEGNIFCQLLGARRHQAAVVPPGRFISMHVQGWDSNTREIVAVGQGTLDWKKIFTAAKTGGVKNYFVEMDLETMRASVPYVRKLQV